jgi:hypothetical protein
MLIGWTIRHASWLEAQQFDIFISLKNNRLACSLVNRTTILYADWLEG